MDGRPQYRFCSCYNIHKELLGEIELVLKKHGIEKPHIYPDVSRVCLAERTRSRSSRR